jgi:hypothetical protein
MEPVSVLPLNLEKPDNEVIKNNLETLEVNENTLKNLDKIKKDIFDFKNQLYFNMVSNDSKHSAGDLGSMMTFQSIFLQTIAHFIGLLDSQLVPEPKFSKGQDKAAFLKLKNKLQNLSRESTESRILLYSLLFKFSTQHAFDLGEKK